MRRAARSSVLASDINTLVMYLWYSKHSPATSYGWGVFISATWGRSCYCRNGNAFIDVQNAEVDPSDQQLK